MPTYPTKFIEEVVVQEIHERLMQKLTSRVYFCWVGIILLISQFKGVQQDEWFSNNPVYIEHGASYNLNNLMFMYSNRLYLMQHSLFTWTSHTGVQGQFLKNSSVCEGMECKHDAGVFVLLYLLAWWYIV